MPSGTMNTLTPSLQQIPSPDEIASELLERAGQTCPPIDLDRVRQIWPDLTVAVEKLDGDGFLIDLGVHGGEIIIRAAAGEARTRYTIAHELGHWVLRTLTPGSVARCDSAIEVGQRMKMTVRPTAVEKWCDRFAANLLMPAHFLHEELRKAKIKGLPEILRERPGVYGVTDHAFRLRISEITQVSIYEMQSSECRLHVLWRYESPKVQRGTLERALANLSGIDPRSGPCIDPSTNFFAVPVVFSDHSAEGQSCQYLLCLLPKSAGS